jgi:hypothetical protein
MSIPIPSPQPEQLRTEDQTLLFTSVFALHLVASGLACYGLGSYAVELVEAAGLDGIVVYILLFLGGLVGLFATLSPLTKPALVETPSTPIDG